MKKCLVGLTFCTCYLASYLTNKVRRGGCGVVMIARGGSESPDRVWTKYCLPILSDLFLMVMEKKTTLHDAVLEVRFVGRYCPRFSCCKTSFTSTGTLDFWLVNSQKPHFWTCGLHFREGESCWPLFPLGGRVGEEITHILLSLLNIPLSQNHQGSRSL